MTFYANKLPPLKFRATQSSCHLFANIQSYYINNFSSEAFAMQISILPKTRKLDGTNKPRMKSSFEFYKFFKYHLHFSGQSIHYLADFPKLF